MAQPSEHRKGCRSAIPNQNDVHNPHNCVFSSPLPWYASDYRGSISEESENPEDDFEKLTAASTPLHVGMGSVNLFASPSNKLGRLDINRGSPTQHTPKDVQRKIPTTEFPNSLCFRKQNDAPVTSINKGPEHDFKGYDATYTPDADEAIANMTFMEVPIYDDDDDDNDDDDDDDGHDTSFDSASHIPKRPVYSRKRRFIDSLAGEYSTPGQKLSQIEEMNTGDVGNETSDSLLKASFCGLDFTPCPSQPRKRAKTEKTIHDLTPSQPSKVNKPLLDLTSSKKLLQSTPANSRPNSPAYYRDSDDEEINGYGFVKVNPEFNYETPKPRVIPANKSDRKFSSVLSEAKDYNSKKYANNSLEGYEIVGNFPVSAAGIMDEDNLDVHVADKRIHDPFLSAPKYTTKEDKRCKLLTLYSGSRYKLPLLEHFERELALDEMKRLINDGVSVRSFYDCISSSCKAAKRSFLKKEGLRWHPDKWEGKFEDSPFDKKTIDSLSSVINGLLDET
ncbi:hypothetical protein OXX59_000124 [Metschnikowia pulcherrima]